MAPTSPVRRWSARGEEEGGGRRSGGGRGRRGRLLGRGAGGGRARISGGGGREHPGEVRASRPATRAGRDAARNACDIALAASSSPQPIAGDRASQPIRPHALAFSSPSPARSPFPRRHIQGRRRARPGPFTAATSATTPFASRLGSWTTGCATAATGRTRRRGGVPTTAASAVASSSSGCTPRSRLRAPEPRRAARSRQRARASLKSTTRSSTGSRRRSRRTAWRRPLSRVRPEEASANVGGTQGGRKNEARGGAAEPNEARGGAAARRRRRRAARGGARSGALRVAHVPRAHFPFPRPQRSATGSR